MAYAVEPQIYTSFKGIREQNGINSGGVISAITCNNVEIFPTEIGSDTGIKSMKGNTLLYTLPTGYKIIGIFKSEQDGVPYTFIYAENETEGDLFYINVSNQPQSLISGLTVTGKCNAITMTSSAYDVFVFTNGQDVRTVCFAQNPQIRSINAVDYQNRSLHWLSMVEWNGFLVVADEYGVHGSHQNDIYTWNDNPEGVANSWYIDFSKKVTAVYAYTGGLYIFTQSDVTFLNTTPNDTANSKTETVAGVGCFSYTSIIKHDTYLFFYDNNQKNVYYIQNIDSGQIRPAGPVAREIQSHFRDVKKFKMFSCVYNNKNEVWCLVNDEILIYDYVQQEWVQRTEQNINTICLISNVVYSGGDSGIIFAEGYGSTFNGGFFPAEYKTTFINLGTNTNLKKQKTPLLIVVNDNEINDFWVELTVNNKTKNPKKVKVAAKVSGYYIENEDPTEIIPNPKTHYGTAIYGGDNTYSKRVVEISTPQTWYTMGIRIYTDTQGQGFSINSMELKNIKMKTKTKGR